MKTIKFLAVAIVVAGILAVPCAMAQNAPADVLKAANDGLQPFLSKIPAVSMEEYGFAHGDDLVAASLGTPFMVHTITPSALEKYQAGMTVASILTPLTAWYFPVLIAGETKAILAVDKIDGQWKAVSLGDAGLAKELGAVSRQWKAAQGYHPMLVVVFQARQFLFTVPEKDAYNLTPLTVKPPATADASLQAKAAPAPANDYATLGTVDNAVNQLKPAVQNALKGLNK